MLSDDVNKKLIESIENKKHTFQLKYTLEKALEIETAMQNEEKIEHNKKKYMIISMKIDLNKENITVFFANYGT